MEQNINIDEFYQIIKKHWRIVLNSAIVGVILALIVTFVVMTPKYQSQTQIVATLPKQQQAQDTNNDVTANLQLVNTYKEFVMGDVVLEKSSRDLKRIGIKRSTNQLKKALQVTQPQNSLMFTIKAKDINRYDAKAIANIVAYEFQKNVQKYLNVNKISIISKAQVPQKPVSPKKGLNILIGLVVGIICGIGLVFVVEMRDLTIKDEDFITDKLGLTVIGHVARISQQQLQQTTNARDFGMDQKNRKDNEVMTRRGRNI